MISLFKPTFLLSILLGVTWFGLNMLDLPYLKIFFITSGILTIVYIISTLYEIYSSNRITLNEKVMWTVGFILPIFIITALLYFFLGRRRILRDYKILNQLEVEW